MLTKITAYSQWAGVDPLVWNIINRPDTDLYEVRDIQGLGSVKASINTTPFGTIKGAAFSGTSSAERNLVFTLGLDPDWDVWTVSRLRRQLESYFMPEQSVRFVFETMEFSPVEISGIIESNDPNMFSKDPEQQISVICPKPDFVAVDPVVIDGSTELAPIDLEYKGNVETGINVRLDEGINSTDHVTINYGDDSFAVDVTVDGFHYMIMHSVPGEKFVRQYTHIGDIPTNKLNFVQPGSTWIKLHPGIEPFSVDVDDGSIPWHLTYYERFGSL